LSPAPVDIVDISIAAGLPALSFILLFTFLFLFLPFSFAPASLVAQPAAFPFVPDTGYRESM
jgi:hypothetical protein